MSYEPTVWKDGDLVTSAKLNKLEQGVANGGGSNVVMGAYGDDDILTLESTWQEIWDNNCTVICVQSINHKEFYSILILDADNYSVTVSGVKVLMTLYAESADDYPTNTGSGSGGASA